MSNSQETKFKPILFSSLLDLSDSQAVETTIVSYIVNRDNKDENIFKVHDLKTVISEYNISIHLDFIEKANGTGFVETWSNERRWFSASFIDPSDSDKETSIAGWIDTFRQIVIWDISEIKIAYIDTGPTPTSEIYSFNMDLLYTVNYTGLPAHENVNIYPESHHITDSFKIIFENNRPEELCWGSDWQFEKWENEKWITPNVTQVWTLELRVLYAYGKTTNLHKFPYDEGIYRISKRCMLTDNYDRDRKEWVDEFTTSFYIVKTSP